jgi:hypothetical protein
MRRTLLAALALLGAALSGCGQSLQLSDDQRAELASRLIEMQYQHNLDMQH